VSSYPTRQFRRPALAPGILSAIVILAGLALLGTSGFIWILYAVSILALIMCVFSWQAKHWWWLIPLAAIAVVWNPVFPLPMAAQQVWIGIQYVAAIVFIVAGVLIKVPNPDDRNRR
jgi:hypothetical protein